MTQICEWRVAGEARLVAPAAHASWERGHLIFPVLSKGRRKKGSAAWR